DTAGISKIRGAVAQSSDDKYKVLPTYHPSAVLRDPALRPITILDLIKARKESAFPEIRRPKRNIYIAESLDDLEWYWNNHIANAKYLAPDIETKGEQITCIGYATAIDNALVIPIVDPRHPGGSYWPTIEHEVKVWDFIRRVQTSPIPKVFQNG